MRDNWHAALIASILANVNRGPNASVIPMSKFFYRDQETDADERDAETVALLDAWKGAGHGG